LILGSAAQFPLN